MRKSTVSKKSNKSKKEEKSLQKYSSGVSKKSKQTAGDGDQSVVNQDQSALIDGDDPAEQLLKEVPPDADSQEESADKQDGDENIPSLEGSVRNEDVPLVDHKAASEKEYPQDDLGVENPDNAD